MVLLLEQAQAGLAAMHLQGAEHRQPLDHVAAVVLIREWMNRVGVAVGRVFQGRVPPELLHIVPGDGALVGGG